MNENKNQDGDDTGDDFDHEIVSPDSGDIEPHEDDVTAELNGSAGQSDDPELFSPRLVAAALRNSGYRNAAYALGELIDNSIQAGAKSVQVLVSEGLKELEHKTVRRISRIAVLDDGEGMSPEVLRNALRFGSGTRLGAKEGLGKFGMGLPSASISQAKRVEVWSWVAGLDSALYTFVDIDDVEKGMLRLVPEPVSSKIPSEWKQASGLKATVSGTLVVWSQIDRCTWVTGKSLIENSEALVGRMYRYFIHDQKVKIRLKVFPAESPQESSLDKIALPNDPLFLMSPSTTSPPFDKKPMFEFNAQTEYPIHLQGGELHQVKIRSSRALKDARKAQDNKAAGSLPHGQDAKKNQGVSILREGRELKLNTTLVNFAEERNRWWGVEIDFPAALDEIMGVTANKQSAIELDAAADEFKRLSALGDRALQESIDALSDSKDPMGVLLGLWQDVSIAIKNMWGMIREQNVVGNRHTSASAGKTATEADRELTEKGQRKPGESDAYVSQGEAEDKNILENAITGQGVDVDVAEKVVAEAFGSNVKFVWVEAPLNSSAFFETSPQAGKLLITINTNHPAYTYLISVLESGSTGEEESPKDESGDGQSPSRFEKANFALTLLLMAWARLEDEASGEAKDRLQEMREDWGRISKKFLMFKTKSDGVA